MAKVLVNSQGKVLTLNGQAIEGNDGGNDITTFYTCSSTIPGAKGGNVPGGDLGNNITFYVEYPNNNNKTPDMFIFYDENHQIIPASNMYADLSDFYYGIISQEVMDTYYGGTGGYLISIKSLSSTLATLQYSDALQPGTSLFDPTKLQFAPIYLS